MNKLDMESKNIVDDNVGYIKEKFPSAVVETEKGYEIDFDILKQELSSVITDERKEKYELTWAGKKKAILTANTPTKNTLRPIKERSVSFDTTENIYIEGDNLEALKILQESYLNKIKCIYIDPPYNTGRNLMYKNDYSISADIELVETGQADEFGNKLVVNSETNGRFHSDWITMMYSRIKLSRNLLTQNGVIVLSIDESELINLTKICDEVFGSENRIGIVTVVHKPEGRNQEKFFGTSNEFMLMYAKDKPHASFHNVILDEEISKKYDKTDKNGKYRLQNFIRLTDGKLALRNVRPNFWYPIYVKSDLTEISDIFSEGFEAVYPISDKGIEMSWKTLPATMLECYKDENLVPIRNENGKITIFEKIRETQVIKTHWVRKEYNAIQYGTKIVTELFGDQKIFDFPKSINLIIDVLKLNTKNDDLILDFFSGSATTAHAVMQLNALDGGKRKYIMVQTTANQEMSEEAFEAGYETICDIGQERIRRAGKKIKEETKTDIDYGFRVYKIDSSNMKDVYYTPSEVKQEQLNMYETNIKEDRNELDVLTQVILDLGLTLDLKVEEKDISGNKVYFIDGNSLVACFDKNISTDIVDEICKVNPLKVVFKDDLFKEDNDKINLQEKFKKLSPDIEISII